MQATRLTVFEHAAEKANSWVHDVARECYTEDKQFAYHILRAWLHTLRDQLGVAGAAHFAAQLPELLRGVYYEGWNPGKVPQRWDVETYTAHFANEAGIAPHDVPKSAAAVTAALALHLSDGQLEKALHQLHAPLRELIQPQD